MWKRCSCVSCLVWGLTGDALDPKLQEKGLIPQRSAGPLLLPLCSLRKQSRSSQLWTSSSAGRTKIKLCLPASGPRICSCSCVMQLGSTAGKKKKHGFFYLCPISLNISATCFSLSNDTVVLNPSKITTSSLISGSYVPPSHLGNLAFVLSQLI